jgi:hypothetical protein
MTLQDIADNLKRRLDSETNPAKHEMLTFIADLVTVLQTKGIPIGDDAATITELQVKIASLNSLLDNDAKTFAAIKTALGNPNLTQGEIANEITTKWRHI